MLRSNAELQRLREHKEELSQKTRFPQNPCIYALMKAGTHAAGLGSGPSNRAGAVKGRSGVSYTAAAAQRSEAGTHTQSIQVQAQEAILDVHQTALWDRREEPMVKIGIKQWAAQLALRHNMAEQEYRQGGGDGDYKFKSHMVEETFPPYFVRKMQEANNQAAVSKSSLDKLAAKMGVSQQKADVATADAAQPRAPAADRFHSSLGKSAAEPEHPSPLRTKHSESSRAAASRPTWTHKMRVSKQVSFEVSGVTKLEVLEIDQLLFLKDTSVDGSMCYIKFEYDGGYAGAWINKSSLLLIGSPVPLQQPRHSGVRLTSLFIFS